MEGFVFTLIADKWKNWAKGVHFLLQLPELVTSRRWYPLAAHYGVTTSHCSLLAAHYSPLTTRRSPLTTHYFSLIANRGRCELVHFLLMNC